MGKKRPTLEQQMASELAELAEDYPKAPQHAKTFEQLQSLFPQVPKKVLRDKLAKLVAEGKWQRTRVGTSHKLVYWKA